MRNSPGVAQSTAISQIGKPDFAGYMKKRGERYNTWKNRYFVLKGPHLYYMKDENVRSCEAVRAWERLL